MICKLVNSEACHCTGTWTSRYGGCYECEHFISEACHCTWTSRYGGWDVYKRVTSEVCHCTGTWTSRCGGWYECKRVIREACHCTGTWTSRYGGWWLTAGKKKRCVCWIERHVSTVKTSVLYSKLCRTAKRAMSAKVGLARKVSPSHYYVASIRVKCMRQTRSASSLLRTMLYNKKLAFVTWLQN